MSKIIKETVQTVLQEHEKNGCCLNGVGISCQEHIEQHKALRKWKKDMDTINKAVLAALATLTTGGIFGLLWLGFKSKIGGN